MLDKQLSAEWIWPFVYYGHFILRSGVFDTLVNLIKIGLGTGVLALPYAASVAGVVGAALCLIVAGVWNYFAVAVMIACMKQVHAFNVSAVICNPPPLLNNETSDSLP